MTVKISGNSSASTPSFAGDDGDSGLHATADQVQLVTNGTVGVTVDSSQNVGVGTTTPNMEMQIKSSGGFQAVNTGEIALRYNAYYDGADKYIQGSNKAASLVLDSSGAFRFYNTDTASSSANSSITGWTERMKLDSDGTIKVHNQMQFTDGASGNDKGAIQAFGDDFSNGNLRFYTKGSGSLDERLRIDSSGHVTMPYQPIASLSDSRQVDLSNTVLNSSNFYNTTWINQGNHFDASTGRFNCPVNGVYRIYFRCSQNGNTGKTNVRLRKNGVTINEAYSNITNDSVSSEIVVSCTDTDFLDVQVAQIHTIGGSQHKQVTFQLLH